MKYLLIPSCEVARRDKLSGTTTERRLKRGISLWKSGGFDRIIVSGGICFPPDVQTLSMAFLMFSWLKERGISGEVILCEGMSKDTFENIAFSLAFIESDRDAEITIVTHWQHALRFWATLRFGYRDCVASVIPMWYWVNLKDFTLEWAMLLVHLLDPRGKCFIAQWNRRRRSFFI
ncbi:MAG: YdcF family protein [bacterium]|nr:YdcF family protein [bacterium]